MTVYSATKAALNALTTGLRMESKGTGVDVLLVVRHFSWRDPDVTPVLLGDQLG